MKYIKKYEGIKSKLDLRIENNKKLKNFVPGAYIIFTYDIYDWHLRKSITNLILANVLNTKSELLEDDSWPPKSYFKNYVYFKVINDVNNNSDTSMLDYNRATLEVDITKIKVLSISISKKESEEKFKELSKDYEMKKSINKYNL